MDAAQEVAIRHVLPWLAMEEKHAEEQCRRTTVRRRDADLFLTRLLAMNAARVQSDLGQRLSRSRHDLEAAIRLLLRDVHLVAREALARARTIHEAGAAEVRSALDESARRAETIRALRTVPDDPTRPPRPRASASSR